MTPAGVRPGSTTALPDPPAGAWPAHRSGRVGDTLAELNEGGGAWIQAGDSGILGNIGITGSTFRDNDVLAGDGGGLYAKTSNGDIMLTDNLFDGNSASFPTDPVPSPSGDQREGGIGGGAHLFAADAVDLFRNDFRNNTADREGGGLHAHAGSEPSVLANNTFFNNTAVGGGPNFTPNDNPQASATAEARGGGVRYFTRGDVDVINNSWFANEATADEGGGISIKAHFGGTIDFFNNIVWSNTAGGLGDDIHMDDAAEQTDGSFLDVSTVNVVINNFSDFTTACITAGGCSDLVSLSGNLDVDPLFAGPGDFHLLPESPMIDAGDPLAPSLPVNDFEGDERDGSPDIGADEVFGAVIPAVGVAGLGVLAVLLGLLGLRAVRDRRRISGA